ncbi:unnamed protein product [Caenorhabditis bovis]|uniref:Peptide-N(4)-(N-acetyl-beta-glucosaminyl)asparagine amidase n=1 Tax=Caenorhabditis bovis TaxID=2654633 RepID=A0A8S1F919_9PELO|nr:unnamed protein product [Caenorhabditis bovis]
MTTRTISSLMELNNFIQSADASRLIVIDFYADWCGPCRFIAPVYEDLANQYRNASFFKVNVDHSRDIMQAYGVRAMPTFVILKNKNEVGRIQGANEAALRDTIQRFYTATPTNPHAATMAEKVILQTFVPYCQQAKYYGDIVYKTLARSVIPEDKIIEASTIDGKLNDMALTHNLLDWFKNEFFEWCDTPKCETCGERSERGKDLLAVPKKEETDYGATRVEVYECKKCKKEVRFPRYNNPAKLLETRLGRCGEWANCFTLIANAMGLEARFILDTSDHVWTEVYDRQGQRWVHCDPCENIIDKPLIYEKGWNKKLMFVVAYGIDHVCDVTWRYVMDSKATAARRAVRLETFNSFIRKLSLRQLGEVPESVKKEFALRRLRELFEMLDFELKKAKIASNGHFGGRISGNEEWRKQRAEFKDEFNPVIINCPENSSEKIFEVTYNCAKNEYQITGRDSVEGFDKLMYECKNVMRKEESDWKMTYLCRKNGTDEGVITWYFDTHKRPVKKCSIKVEGRQIYDNARLDMMLCAGDTCTQIKGDKFEAENLTGDVIKVSAIMSRGSSENAFQHAQLFRCAIDDTNAPHLQISIEFE